MAQLTPAAHRTNHRTIVVVDVEGFSQDRYTHDMLAVRNGMYAVLERAFAEAAIDFESCDREDRGDGALILVPPTVSKSTIADLLPERIVAELRRYNAERVATSRMKLRVGLDFGDILFDGNGWVGHEVITAFRILDAQEAKSRLAASDRMVALIVSENFYNAVIREDPGTVPEAYDQIDVRVKTFRQNAWLRLLGHVPPAPPAPPPVKAAPRPDPPVEVHNGVQDVISTTELESLREWLVKRDVPRLPVILSRAAGTAIPLPRRGEVPDAWEAVRYLADFNAGPDGIPPAVLFLDLIAVELGGEAGERITTWVDDQARRLRITTALDQLRRSRAPVPEEPHLYLTILIEDHPLDPTRCVLSYWRQDDPDVWPPPRGEILESAIDSVEFLVDKVILEAEEAWAEQGIAAAVEFLLPRTLLHLPVTVWQKEHDSGQPRYLYLDYRLSIRSLERMRSRHWHRVWHGRWDSMLKDPSAERVHYSRPAASGEQPIDAVLSQSNWVGLVMSGPPPPVLEPGPNPDELVTALRSGLPVIFWHPRARREDMLALVGWVLDGQNGFLDLPARRKLANSDPTVPVNDSLIRELVVMWDDPERLLVLDQPLIPTQP